VRSQGACGRLPVLVCSWNGVSKERRCTAPAAVASDWMVVGLSCGGGSLAGLLYLATAGRCVHVLGSRSEFRG
jgi:hypothetical protein